MIPSASASSRSAERIPARQVAEGRRFRIGALSRFADGVTATTAILCDRVSTRDQRSVRISRFDRERRNDGDERDGADGVIESRHGSTISHRPQRGHRRLEHRRRNWEVAAPLALGYMGQRLARIETAEAFACRARYDKPGAVPSEHAKGNAVDIAAFVLADGRRIFVKQQDDETARNFVHALRMTACGYFTTVLGPGTDPAHEAHFHFGSGLHGATRNYRICE